MKEKLIICPNEEKMKILKSLSNMKELLPIKFMTKNEFLSNYYFSYDENTIFYLMNKYNYNIDVCKVYLKYLYVIDENKEYNNSKLNFLRDLKKELINNNLLKYHKSFHNYISNKEIEVKNYYDLDLYEEKIFNIKVNLDSNTINSKVYEFNTLEEEVNYVCIKIIELIRNGIDINKIYLTNVSEEYYYTLDRLFGYYNIPINIPYKNTIYSTKVVKDYLDTHDLDLLDESKKQINKKLINILGSISNLDIDNPITHEILIDKIKDTYLSNTKLDKAINIKDLFKEEFTSDEYIFVLGFNQDVLPKTYKDIDYLNDKEKPLLDMYTTDYLNEREISNVVHVLSNIKNLFLSYKLSSPFETYYRSNLIDKLNLEVITNYSDTYNYSNIYNKLRLGEMLDKYNLYGEKDKSLDLLYSNYTIPYNTYSNRYTGINNDTYLTHLAYPLKISYTSLNSYNECKFKYYLTYVLKLDEYESTFPAFIGSLFHELLSLYKNPNFDLETEYNRYLEKRSLSFKEKLLLVRIKKDLIKFIDKLKEQDKLTNYKDALYEEKVEIDLNKNVSVKFIGFIDKILYYKNIEDTYFSIIDYKTGKIDTNIEPMKYGLHMQLPVYLYLINYGRKFTSPIFTGIYYQNILFNYPTWSDKMDNLIKDNYLLKGYSTTNTDVLSNFDITYKDSELIKSMKYSDEKGFGTYSKVIDDDTMYNLIKFTKKEIDTKTDSILNSDFEIDPKVYVKDNISCEYCKFKDICFMKEKDLKYLDKVEDLSFLGGEE